MTTATPGANSSEIKSNCCSHKIIYALIAVILVSCTILLTSRPGLIATINKQLKAIKSGDYQAAYSMTSKSFQDKISYKEFKLFIEEYPVVKSNRDTLINKKVIGVNTGNVIAMITADNGTKNEILYTLTKQNGKWKIMNIEVLRSNEELSPTEKSSDSDPATPTPNKTFSSLKDQYTISYPADWILKQPSVSSIEITHKNKAHMDPITVSIQALQVTKNDGRPNTILDVLETIKQHAKATLPEVEFIAEKDIEFEPRPHRIGLKGKYFVLTYIQDGKKFEKLQYILTGTNAKKIYTFSYTSPVETFKTNFTLIQPIFGSWSIK